MADSANVLLLDELIQHQVYVERFKKGQLGQLRELLQKLMDDVSAQLGQRGTDLSGSRRSKQLERLLADIGQLSDTTAESMNDLVRGQLKDLATYESGLLVSAVRAVLPTTVSFTTVAPDLLWAAVTDRPFEGRQLEQWFKDYSVNQKARITEAVRMSVIEGETIDQTIRRIRGTKALNHQDGIVQGITRRGAESLARTAVNHTVTTARGKTIADNQNVVKGEAWRSTLDGSTSEICIARDGKVYQVGVGPRPPAHPNCRSTIVPVLKSWKELGINLKEAPEGTRSSLNGQVPASETYQTWLKRQPVAFQDEVLGTTKGQLYRSGGLSVDKFVDEQSGRGYTIDQLRTKHPEAFKQAGL